MTINGESAASASTRGPAWMAVGGLLGALAASSCCILPLVLFGLGISVTELKALIAATTNAGYPCTPRS
jgi:hypothetical protein